MEWKCTDELLTGCTRQSERDEAIDAHITADVFDADRSLFAESAMTSTRRSTKAATVRGVSPQSDRHRCTIDVAWCSRIACPPS